MNQRKFPLVALIGQKNVGKSTLFNRLTRSHDALIADCPGLTRDRQYGHVKYKKNMEFTVIDTGGFDNLSKTVMQNHVNNQVVLAAQESYIILFIINGKFEESLIDYNIIEYFRKLQKEMFLIINKMDDVRLYRNKNFYKKYNYYSLGIKNIAFISALHGYGINYLIKKILLKISNNLHGIANKNELFTNVDIVHYNYFLKKPLINREIDFIKLAVVGRPNSGKSTFINYMLKENRMITSDIPGTTRDSVSIPVLHNNQKFILIDTAGVRRRNKIDDLAEQISVLKTLKILQIAHIVLFMIDVYEGIVDQDLSLLRFIVSNSKSLILVISKCDTLSISEKQKAILELLKKKATFLNFAKVHFISSFNGIGIKVLLRSVEEIYKFSTKKIINTAQLNRIMNEAVLKYPPRFSSKIRVIPYPKYVHIGGYNPITIIIHGTKVSQLPNEYRKYLRSYFCRSLNIKGVSLCIYFKDTNNPFDRGLRYIKYN